MRVMVRAMVLSALVPPSHLTAASTEAWHPCHACLATQWSRRYPAHLQQNCSDTLDAYKLERWWCRCMSLRTTTINVVHMYPKCQEAGSSGSMHFGEV